MIPTGNDSYYKCRACKLNYVCKRCSNVRQIHNLEKQIKDLGVKLAKANLAAAPFLTEPTGSCQHCFNLIYPSQDRYYLCQQCPNGFEVCTKCINLMKTKHSPQHTFKKDNYSLDEHMIIHYNTLCDGCKAENFKGIRYHCDECRASYDLCKSCYQNANKLHPNHKFTIVQAPLLRINNYLLLAKRAIEVCQRFPNLQYDPLTGYSLKDAQQVKDKEENNLNQFWQQRLQEAQYAQQIQRQIHKNTMDTLKHMTALMSDNYHIMETINDDDYY
ncbi:unnamed protein product [Rotaria sp. Silwood2]|nr:unnamed protein product [Rotaria sp. Silwood2]CAF3447977.1 unnamed protein product [Rotaria sp. Silwood2]CAF4745026.1 unnamed protein product [Rotaria sp. Silwood2]